MIRTRIAPSPTGLPHIGTIYQAMLDKAYAKKHQGQFIIRIENTDQKRFVPGAEEKLYEALDWFNLTEDISPRKTDKLGPYKQSERLVIYKKYAEELISKGHAYYCFCTQERLNQLRKNLQQEKKSPLYDKHCRNLTTEEIQKKIKQGVPHVIRMKIPENTDIVVEDLVRGKIKFKSNLIDEQVILKSDGFPTYHLAVVVDDHLMQITHLLRGPEWLPSFPKHQLLYQYFGWKMPVVIHTPMITNMDGSKMSKRHGHANVDWYKEQGYLPQAILNFLALMGWSHPKEIEIFSYSEFIKVFDFKDLSPQAPKFDLKKLEWMNSEYIRHRIQNLELRIKNYLKDYLNIKVDQNKIKATIPLVKTRMKTLADYWPLAKFIFEQPNKIDFPLNSFKQVKTKLLKKYEQIEWKHENIYKETEQTASNSLIKPIKLYMDLRYALSNQKVTAPLFEGMEIAGKKAIIKRLNLIN